jgi:hypothetical protein
LQTQTGDCVFIMKPYKHMNVSRFLVGILFSVFAIGNLQGATNLVVSPPILDSEGRFWVYHNGPAQPHMPFAPYGWMSDVTNLAQAIQIDLECRDRPLMTARSAAASVMERCIRLKLTWEDATWAGVAFISGPDKPGWWGETNRGRYFDLGALPKKKLAFSVRGERGGEHVKIQIGILGNKPFGDSLSKPIIGEELELTQDWVHHEIDLKDIKISELRRICNGFGVIAERANQAGSPAETQFYIDEIYFE